MLLQHLAYFTSEYPAKLWKQVSMYYGSGTVDRIASGQLTDAAAYAVVGGCRWRQADAALALIRWQHFSAEVTSWLPS